MASDAVLSVRFSEDELAELRSKAEGAGLALSTYIRRHVLASPVAATIAFGQTSVNTVADPSTPTGVQTTGYAGAYVGPS